MYPRSGTQSPFTYIKRKRAIRNASKPTAVDIITTRPYINPQVSSPLFTLLPAEIRQQIFQFAFVGYPDPARPYSRHSYWHRPGYTHARAINISLLLTCRRIYLESDLLPVIQNEHIIWGVERSRIPPRCSSYLLDNSMRQSQRNAIQRVHLFTQQFWLEDWKDKWLAYAQSWPDGCPPTLRITIRHTDWWYNLLGENSPLALDPKRKGRARLGEWIGENEPFEPGSWGQRFAYMKGLKEFELELETVVSKKAELDIIVDKASVWKFPLGDGQILLLDESATEKTAWTGSKYFKGLSAVNVPAALQFRQGSTVSFSGLSKKRNNSMPEEITMEDSLHYYVVTLTWRAHPMSVEHGTRGSDDTIAIPTTPIQSPTHAVVQVTTPRVSYHRLNAIPTSYG